MASKITNDVSPAQLAIAPGDRVIYGRDAGGFTADKAKSAPYKAADGTWVIHLEGISGFVALCRVLPCPGCEGGSSRG